MTVGREKKKQQQQHPFTNFQENQALSWVILTLMSRSPGLELVLRFLLDVPMALFSKPYVALFVSYCIHKIFFILFF